MGEVYKARDTRLDRIVAIKILPVALAGDPQFRERFDREARAISQLDHPNICALFDRGEQDGTSYLVMQFLEGETLADRIARGAVPLDQALPIAVQIADALATAHRAAIVHRDLKPGNVMLTRTGAKLLDFGLAKSGASIVAGSGVSMLPTTPAALTMQGQILGTFQYMAPEQLEGDEADARTDIFAFGALLHEMVTGRKAFEGKSHASLVAAILERTPPSVSSLQPVAPPALDRVVSKCLAKDPDDRWQSAKDLKDALKWVSADGSQGMSSTTVAAAIPARRRRGWLAWAIAAALLAALAVSLWLGRQGYLQPPAELPPVSRALVPLPENMLLADLSTAEAFALSPDGRYLAFAAVGAASGRTRTLWVRPLDALSAHELPGTENAAAPFWSPDSKFIAFMAAGKLKKINVTAGRPNVLADASTSMKGSWAPDDTIVFVPRLGGLSRVSASGGEVTPVEGIHASGVDVMIGSPSFLPDGRHFLYYAEKQSGSDAALWVSSLEHGASPRRVPGVTSSALYAQGYLFFLRDQTLMAQPFDPVRVELNGDPVALADQVDVMTRPLRGAFTLSRAGALAYRTGTSIVRTQLTWFDRSGKQLSAVGGVSDQLGVELSPDSTRALVSVLDPSRNARDLWIYELARGLRTRFTFDPADEMGGVWSPDGSQIVFNSRRVSRLDLYLKPSSGAGTETPWFADSQNNVYPAAFTPDGRSLIYFNGNASSKTGNDIWRVPVTGDRKPVPVVQTEFNETYPQISADGRWMAYVSTEAGRAEVYVTAYPGPGGKWQVSTTGASAPRWRRDGKELFFIGADRKLLSATVNGQGATFTVGAVQALFDTTIRQVGFAGGNGINYDISPDGQRFLILSTQDNAATTPITLVMNWTGLVKK
jgi:eukaryotic-like serine/threonine-protein kinase